MAVDIRARAERSQARLRHARQRRRDPPRWMCGAGAQAWAFSGRRGESAACIVRAPSPRGAPPSGREEMRHAAQRGARASCGRVGGRRDSLGRPEAADPRLRSGRSRPRPSLRRDPGGARGRTRHPRARARDLAELGPDRENAEAGHGDRAAPGLPGRRLLGTQRTARAGAHRGGTAAPRHRRPPRQPRAHQPAVPHRLESGAAAPPGALLGARARLPLLLAQPRLRRGRAVRGVAHRERAGGAAPRSKPRPRRSCCCCSAPARGCSPSPRSRGAARTRRSHHPPNWSAGS